MRSSRAVALLLAVLAPAGALASEEWSEEAEKEMAKAGSYLQQGDLRAALDHFDAARQLAPERPGPYFWLGIVHAQLKQCERAVPELNEYLLRKIDGPKPQALRTLEECKVELARRPSGSLAVTSLPPGATVRLDDERGPPAGETPLTLPRVVVGPHRIFLERAGFAKASASVQVQAGVEATVVLPLARVKGRVPH